MAAMMASVAAVSERSVEVFVSMSAVRVFGKNQSPSERYLDDSFSKFLCKAPDAIDLFRQGKELGDLKLWACSMALDVQGWELSNLEEDIFDGPLGLTKFLADAESGQFVTL